MNELPITIGDEADKFHDTGVLAEIRLRLCMRQVRCK
jgi:hypothetical protein